MATLPQVIDALVTVDGRDHATLMQFGRVIREAGLIPRGKRGGGAPHMTERDLVTLLLGIYGSSAPKDAPETVMRLSSLRPLGSGLGNEQMPDVLRRIDAAENLFDALLAALVGTREILAILDRFVRDSWPDEGEEFLVAQRNLAWHGLGNITFRVALRTTTAEISLTSREQTRGTSERKTHWGRSFLVDVNLFMDGKYGNAGEWDRQPEVTFGMKTLVALFQGLTDDVPENAEQ